ncbi:MAG: phosphatidylserine decarboxylase family protein [Rikenellaceae bacterium]
MKLHKIDKEGRIIIITSFIICGAISVLGFLFLPQIAAVVKGAILLVFWILIIRFFRLPYREIHTDPDKVYSPADGTIVVIEKTFEEEYFKDERIQVSVFMSVWNVHANWYSIDGIVKYFRHHNGKFMVAWHPKSSTENERTTIVVENAKATLLFRQIAGLLARRIVTYATEGQKVAQNQRMGFIKFGSRVDIFLPLDAEISVEMGQKVVGSQTEIAKLK